MANIQTKLDITKNISTNKGFTGRLGDKGETLDFYLYDNGVELDLTGYTMAFVGNNSKNQYSTASGSRIENTTNGMRVIIPSSFNSRVGDFLNCYVELRKGSTVVRTTGDFFYTVLPNADLDSEVADEYVSQLEELLNQINDRANQFFDTLVAKFEQLDEDITDLQNEFNTFNTTVMTKIDEIMNKLTSLDVYTKKETDDKFVPKTQIADGNTAGITKVIDNLNSLARTNALSAYAGKLLDDKIRNIPIQKIAPKPATDLPSTYSVGISITDGTTNLGYPNNYCIVETIKYDTARATQYCFPRQYLVATDKIYIRSFGSSSDTWGGWQTIIMGKDVVHNLTTTATDLPLSAGMGKQLKESMVNIADNQTIGGIKNFTKMPKLNGVDLLEDTGWKSLTPKSGYTWVSGYPVQYRKVGSIVYLRGRVTNNATMGAVANLPAGLRTPRQLYFTVSVAATGADAIGKYTIDTNGDITLRSATTTNYPTVLDNIYYFVD